MVASLTRHEVSRSHPAIKRVLEQTVLTRWAWKGRKIVVLEVGPDWYHHQYIDDQDWFWTFNLETGAVKPATRPTYGGPVLKHTVRPSEVLVKHGSFMGEDSGVEIIVAADPDRAAALLAVQDAVLGKEPRATRIALGAFGQLAPIMSAVVEARCGAITKAEKKLTEVVEGSVP